MARGPIKRLSETARPGTANLSAQRLLKAYRDAAAKGYRGGAADFARLADLAEDCVANSNHEEWLPATVILNAFHNLSKESTAATAPQDKGIRIPPEFHAAVVSTLEVLVRGGDAARCRQLSEQLVRTYPKTQEAFLSGAPLA